MVSPTLDMIAQMTGKLTTKRYKYATVFVENFYQLLYVCLQKTSTVEETLEEKKAFESYAASHNVQILNYHADNGIFRANDSIKTAKVNPIHKACLYQEWMLITPMELLNAAYEMYRTLAAL